MLSLIFSRGPNGEDCGKSTELFPEMGQTLSLRGEAYTATIVDSRNRVEVLSFTIFSIVLAQSLDF